MQLLPILCCLFLGCLKTLINGERSMYVLCPPSFVPVGNTCYFISKEERVNWLDAHFECKERNSRLAEPSRKEDRLLRKYLNKLNGFNLGEMWIGARFNWERNKWQWGYNGEDLIYQSFSQMSADNKDLKFHCAILKPKLKYRWSASSCEQQLQYICQHKIKFVNEKKRHEIYTRWNETYPNQMANEVLHIVSKDDLLKQHNKRYGQQSKRRSNSRQTKNEINQQNKNDNHHTNSAYQKPIRKTAGNGRNRTNKRFDLNRYRAHGIRQSINFTSTRQQWRQKQRWHKPPTGLAEITSTISPSTTTLKATSMPTPTTTTTKRIATQPVLSNDVNHVDVQYTNLAQESISDSNILTKSAYQTEQFDDDTELIRQHNEEATHQLAIQTNEILDNVITTTLSPREIKKRKLKSLRNQLSKLTPEQQQQFFKRRAERNKKRGITQ